MYNAATSNSNTAEYLNTNPSSSNGIVTTPSEMKQSQVTDATLEANLKEAFFHDFAPDWNAQHSTLFRQCSVFITYGMIQRRYTQKSPFCPKLDFK